MGERADLEGREPFLDPIEEPEPLDPAFTPHTPYGADIGTVRGDMPSTPLHGGITEGYGLGDEEVLPPTSSEVEAQRAHVEETRGQMGETIDAIQEKLSPANLAQQAKETVKGATVGKVQDAVSTTTDSVQQAASTATATAQGTVASASDTAKGMGSTIAETVRQNPMPAALAGLGLGWLIASARKQSRGQPSSPSTGQTITQVQDTAGQAVSQAKDTVGQVTGQVQGTAQQTMSQAQSQVSQLGTQVKQQSQQTKSKVSQMMQQNPLAAGAVALALGTSVGLAAPKTQPEDKLMGQAKENLTQKAQQTVQETAQKAQSVAQEAVGTAKEEAKKQGLGQ